MQWCCIQTGASRQGFYKRRSRWGVETNPIPPLIQMGLYLPQPVHLRKICCIAAEVSRLSMGGGGRFLLLPQFLNYLHGQRLLNTAKKRSLGPHPPFTPPHFPQKGCMEGRWAEEETGHLPLEMD